MRRLLSFSAFIAIAAVAPFPALAGDAGLSQLRAEIDALESRIAETEAAIRDLEQKMAASGFYDDRAAAQPIIDEHQSLMWKVGDLMHRWEELQSAAGLATAGDA